jgi:triosephosphate isomerase (TIM)
MTVPGTTVAISLKMYFTGARTLEYCRSLADLADRDPGVRSGSTDLIVLPTFIWLSAALEAVRDSRVHIGAQDLAMEDSGAFTGEVSGAELAEIGCTHVEVGHAERRSLFHETDTIVAAKTQAAFRHGLIPILCVGEPTRTNPMTAAELCTRELLSAVTTAQGGGGLPDRMIIAYEPFWAIGAAQPAPSSYVAEVCQRVRIALADQLRDFAIIYGGSAGPGLLTDLGTSVDGLFLGRFAHDPGAVAAVLSEATLRREHQSAQILPDAPHPDSKT